MPVVLDLRCHVRLLVRGQHDEAGLLFTFCFVVVASFMLRRMVSPLASHRMTGVPLPAGESAEGPPVHRTGLLADVTAGLRSTGGGRRWRTCGRPRVVSSTSTGRVWLSLDVPNVPFDHEPSGVAAEEHRERVGRGLDGGEHTAARVCLQVDVVVGSAPQPLYGGLGRPPGVLRGPVVVDGEVHRVDALVAPHHADLVVAERDDRRDVVAVGLRGGADR